MKIGQLFKVNDPEEIKLYGLEKEITSPDFIRIINMREIDEDSSKAAPGASELESDTIIVTARVSQDNQFQEYAYIYLMDLMDWWAEGYIARLTPDIEAKLLLGENKV